MLLSTLFTAATALACVAAAAVPLEERNVTPEGRVYTVLGCLDYQPDPEDIEPSPDGTAGYKTIDECLRRPRRGATRLMAAMSKLDSQGKGHCWVYRNNGPNITTLTLPATQDGWCKTNKGVTALGMQYDLQYVGCYKRMWWYKAPFKPQWGSFPPAGQTSPEPIPVQRGAVNPVQLDTYINFPVHQCVRNCLGSGFAGAAMNTRAECHCTNADVGKTKPAKCTADTWRFYWQGEGPIPRGANRYNNGGGKANTAAAEDEGEDE